MTIALSVWKGIRRRIAWYTVEKKFSTALSCPDVPPLRLRGTGMSIRCRMTVMCSDKRQRAAVPVYRYMISVPHSYKDFRGGGLGQGRTFAADDSANFRSSAFLSAFLYTLKGYRVPSSLLCQPKISVR